MPKHKDLNKKQAKSMCVCVSVCVCVCVFKPRKKNYPGMMSSVKKFRGLDFANNFCMSQCKLSCAICGL